MKANIVLGGLLGIALGAGAVFGLAHAVPAEPVAAPTEPRPAEPDDAEEVSTAAEPSGTPIRRRPLRPGSERIGRLLQS
jgi:hypothetical protein